MTDRPVGCAAKLAYVQTHVPNVDQTGFNPAQKFKYFQEHGIFEVLRPLQVELGFAYTVNVTHLETDGNMRFAVFTVTMIDTDKAPGELDREISASYPNEASDSHGWGVAKLLTYGNKFALQKFFAIPTLALPEQEAEGVKSEPAGKRKAPKAVPKDEARKINVSEASSLVTAANGIGANLRLAASHVLGGDIGEPTETNLMRLNVDQAAAIMDAFRKKADAQTTLEETV